MKKNKQKATFTFIYKKPVNSSKTQEEVINELVQSTIKKVIAN